MPGDFTGQDPVTNKDQFDPKVILLDDYEGTLRWIISGTGSDFAGVKATAASFHSDNGMQLDSKTTTPADGDIVTAKRTVDYPEGSVVYAMFRFALYNASRHECVTFTVDFIDGEKNYRVAFKYSPNTPKLEYYNGAGGWTAIAGCAFGTGDFEWQSIKFSFDVGKHEYLDVLFKGVRVSLDDIACEEIGADTDRKMVTSIEAEAMAGYAVRSYYDCVYVGEHLDL